MIPGSARPAQSSRAATLSVLALVGGWLALVVAAYALTGRAPDISLFRGRGYVPVAVTAVCDATFLALLWRAARGDRVVALLCAVAGLAPTVLLLHYVPGGPAVVLPPWEAMAARAAMAIAAVLYLVLWIRGCGPAARRMAADLTLSLGVTVVALGVAEGAYRVYLWRALVADFAERSKDVPDPTFGFYAYPPPWRFDRELGFSFTDGPTRGGSIAKGSFAGCDATAVRGNKYGNASEARGDYEHAELKIAWFGSSFTMGDPGWRGDTATNQLQEMLSRQLGKRVVIMNYSRDATGILTMLDMARARIPIDRPDLILFTFNSTAPAYQRQWRVVEEARPGFYRMYQSLDPSATVDKRRALLVGIPIAAGVTPQWCDTMQAAYAARDAEKLRSDPLVLDLIAEYNAMRREREVPPPAIDFATLRASFIYNRIARQDAFFGMKLFESNTIYGQLEISSLSDDPQFAAAMAYVRDSHIPFQLVHVPTRYELQSGRQYEFGAVGVPDKLGATIMQSFERAAGRETLDLAPYYAPAVRAKPLDFVISEKDAHPNEAGIREMAEAFDRLLNDKVFPLEGVPRAQ